MAEQKERVMSAIAKAQENLETAMAELEKIPAFDAGSVTFAAHALNNYLTVTSGTIELILMRVANDDDPQLRIWLESAHHAMNLMGRVVTQMTTTESTADGSLRLEEIDLPTMVQRVCSYYQRAADKKSIRIVATSTIDVPPVWADRVMTAAVLDNLVSNAVKYSPRGTQIVAQVCGDRDGAAVSIQDEGPGLSRDDQAKLFQRGTKLTPRPTGGEVSTGYGLAVAKELIERLGGTIWCQSTLGQGSCFSFRLPAKRAVNGEA